MNDNPSNTSVLTRWIIYTVALASISTVLISANNAEQLGVGTSILPLVFWFWYMVFYGGITGGLLLLIRLVEKLSHNLRQWSPLIWWSVPTIVLIAGSVHYSLLLNFLYVHYPLRFSLLGLGTVVLSVIGLVVSIRHPSPAGLIVSLGVFICLLTALYPIPEHEETVVTEQLNLTKQSPSPGFIFLAIDGADWDYINPLIERGELPNFKSLKKSGVHGDLETITPTSSPVIWTSVATGRAPADHDVSDFVSLRITGSDELFGPIEPVAGFSLKPFFRRVIKEPIPVNNRNRSKPAYWNISSSFNTPLSLINWWVTWPAEPIEGYVVSDRIHYRGFGKVKGAPDEPNLTYPDQLYEEIKEIIFKPTDLTFGQARRFMNIGRDEFEEFKNTNWKHHQLKGEFRYIYSIFQTNRRVTDYLIEKGNNHDENIPDLMVLFRMIDLLGHTALRYSTLVDNHIGASPEAQKKYGNVLSQGYREIDAVIGEVKEAHPAKNIILVSDHGFQLETRDNGRKWYNHKEAPAGIFLASGPSFRSGQVKGLHVFDILPLLCYLKGFPVAENFENSVPKTVFSSSFKRGRPVRTIPTYGEYEAGQFHRGSAETNRRIKNQLEALGYIE